MSELTFTTIDRVFSMLTRDLKGEDVNETDIIEWTGLALGFMKVPNMQEEVLSFLKVSNYHACLPENFQMVLQIARYNGWKKEEKQVCIPKITEVDTTVEEEDGECYDCEEDYSEEEYAEEGCDLPTSSNNSISFSEISMGYNPWVTSENYVNNFTPVRLSNHVFFKNLVCKEKLFNQIYNLSCGNDEYTIVGTQEKKLRFSFKEGLVALSCIKTAVDKETGYPLVPDNSSCLSAIVYFIKWKLAESYSWSGREGWETKADKAEVKWLKYVRQFNSYMKMPKTLDDYQNLLESSHNIIPNHKKYYNYFGSLSKDSQRKFNTTNRR